MLSLVSLLILYLFRYCLHIISPYFIKDFLSILLENVLTQSNTFILADDT